MATFMMVFHAHTIMNAIPYSNLTSESFLLVCVCVMSDTFKSSLAFFFDTFASLLTNNKEFFIQNYESIHYNYIRVVRNVNVVYATTMTTTGFTDDEL